MTLGRHRSDLYTVAVDQPTEQQRGMGLALEQARLAHEQGEVPIGCVIVKDGRLLGRGFNRVMAMKDATAHAEILAISAASATIGDWRLEGATAYVTVEPCPMCAGALLLSRVSKVVFGAAEPKFGALGSMMRFQDVAGLNHRYEVEGGVLAEESGNLLREFFRELRLKKSERCESG